MTRGCLVSLFLFLSATLVRADEATPALVVGQRAPDLNLDRLLQSQQEAFPGLESLKGHVICVEFWASWCGPCVKAIPHMNDLAEKLADKPVHLISITSEDESVVKKFCAKNPIRGWIGLDPDRSTARAYGIKCIPCTVLIDRAGKIAGVTSPEQVTDQHILDVLKGKPVHFKPRRAIELDEFLEVLKNDEMARTESLFELSIQPSQDTKSARATGSPGDYDAKAMSLRMILIAAYDVRLNRILGSLPILDQLFDVRFHAPLVPRSRAARLLQDALCSTLCLSVQTETREVDAYVLTLPDVPEKDLRKGNGLGSFSTGRTIKSRNYPISELARALEDCLKVPVLDETGLKGGFDYELTIDRNDPQRTFTDIEKRLGLKVIRARRPVEFLMVDRSE